MIADGKITIRWTGVGLVESAPTIAGPWTIIDAAFDSPYTEDLLPGQNLFYRLIQ